ncbi:MAG: 30S ribosomal protein S4 [Planctomycetes bacterium]|nr:30S ribosomal protein S4 [Planctomycetota bacterium]
MAKVADAKCRLCRREGVLLYLKGARCFTEKCAARRRETPPGLAGRKGRGRMSEYGTRLREKQKLKRIYGLHERGFRRVFEEAGRLKGNTGENLLMLLERRLDNVLYAMGFAASRAAARQSVVHGHVNVNGRRVTAPGYVVRAGDVVAAAGVERSRNLLKGGLDAAKALRQPPSWVQVDEAQLSGNVITLPKRQDVPFDINELFVVEVCSR